MAETPGGVEEHKWNFEHKGDEAKADMVASAATTLTQKVKDLFSVDGLLAQLVEKARGVLADGYEDPTEDEPVAAGIAISGNSRYTGSGKGPHWVFYVLLIIGIMALVTAAVISIRAVDRLEAAYIERGIRDDERFRTLARAAQRQADESGRHDERLDRLEGQRRDAESDAQSR
jgi:hypothetical protein